MSVAENLGRVREQIELAAQHAGRPPKEITLVAVSKTVPVELIIEAYEAGARDLGENRVEEAGEKIPAVNQLLGSGKIRWHLIGHLQRRKTREAVALFNVIQAVDTLRLAETMNRIAAEEGKKVPILLQVNVGNDPNKFGFDTRERETFFQQVGKIVTLPQLQVEGLMTIGPLVATAEQTRPFFRDLRILNQELAQKFPQAAWRELSMGMTDDYAVAIEEGATIVRIGRAIFWSTGEPNVIGETLRTTIELFFDIVSLLILARILLSFVPQYRGKALVEVVYSITEPILRPFQRLIPPMGMFDLSPIVAIIALGVIQWILLQFVDAAFGIPV